MFNKIVLSLIALLSLPSFAMQMTRVEEMKASSNVGNIELFHSDKGFFVKKDGDFHKAVSYHKNQALNSKQLKSVLKQGAYFNVEDLGNHNYQVNLKGKLKGNGPIAAWWAYGATKTILYGLGITGVSAGVAATGGVIGAVGGGALALGTTGASVGASVIAGAVGSSGALGASAVAATTLGAGAAITSTGGSIMLITGAIEGASLAVGAFFAWLPIP